jgi:hypothetical protein
MMNELLKKLNYKAPANIYLLESPSNIVTDLLLQNVGEETQVHTALTEAKVHFAIGFAITQEQVNTLATGLALRAEGDAIIWLAYPKGTSKNYKCDFNRDTGWAILGNLGYEGVRQIAIDADWSALRFRKTEYIKTLARDNKRAMSEAGKERTEKKES